VTGEEVRTVRLVVTTLTSVWRRCVFTLRPRHLAH
jgi:hypothetical protein